MCKKYKVCFLNSQNQSSLCSLPEEVLISILKCLDVPDLLNIKRVNFKFYSLVNGRGIWKEFQEIRIRGVFIYKNLNRYLTVASNLTKLYISAIVCTELTFLAYCTKLEVLVLRGYYFNSKDAPLLSGLSSCKHLKGLDISGFNTLNHNFFVNLSESLPYLVSLRAVDTFRVNPGLMWLLLNNWPKLSSIEIDPAGDREEWSNIVHKNLQITFSHSIIDFIPLDLLEYGRHFYSSPELRGCEDFEIVDLRWTY